MVSRASVSGGPGITGGPFPVTARAYAGVAALLTAVP